ncbi:hypothetical protein RIF29_30032 [Crotalaria pallida]|uniref:Pectinesterase inhibitor domain-containing protein n=1 Tax=Crotalaria pallida TaxID=3830 RepID=A0AAN9EMF4_CROPI
MTTSATFLLLLLAMATTTSCYQHQEMEILQMAKIQVAQAMSWAEYTVRLDDLSDETSAALRDCAKLYEESECRISHMMRDKNTYAKEDALTWVSAVMTNHRTCLDGLEDNGYVEAQVFGKNLSMLLGEALVLYSKNKAKVKGPTQVSVSKSDDGLLASWSAETSKAHFTVAQDGSGTHKTIREAVDALAAMGDNRPIRAVIYVKTGIYKEKVEVGNKLKNVMFIGDGIDKTIVTGNQM